MLKPTLLAACLAMICGSAWAADPPAAKAPAAKAQSKAAPCLQTGSRIVRKDGKCGVTFGRSYTREDLNRTGRIDNAQALKALDPSL
jgi:hypothetical protein